MVLAAMLTTENELKSAWLAVIWPGAVRFAVPPQELVKPAQLGSSKMPSPELTVR